MDTALSQKFPFILDRNLAKANSTGNRVCTSCDTVVLGCTFTQHGFECPCLQRLQVLLCRFAHLHRRDVRVSGVTRLFAVLVAVFVLGGNFDDARVQRAWKTENTSKKLKIHLFVIIPPFYYSLTIILIAKQLCVNKYTFIFQFFF